MRNVVSRKLLLSVLAMLCTVTPSLGRHPFRPPNPCYPKITAQWPEASKKYQLISPYVRVYPLFAFKTEDLYQYLIPHDSIQYRSDSQAVSGDVLSALIESTVKEIKKRKRKIRKNKQLTHFKILQDKNFNYQQSCGLIVLKFKKYPFVLKLFMETPKTILNYRATGMEPIFFFYMGGGANRHLNGFTRLKNREAMIKKLSAYPRWKHHVKFPRKWFWLPAEKKDIIVTGQNLGGPDQIQTHIPSVYAIIADEIDLTQETMRIPWDTKNRIIMQLCNDLDLYIDPHAKNFTFTEDKSHKKFDITIIDTEHFPTMVGLQKARRFKSHGEWYIFLANKCFNDMYLQTKRDLLEAQTVKSELSLT